MSNGTKNLTEKTMNSFRLFLNLVLICSLTMGAKTHFSTKKTIDKSESNLLVLKSKKELNDKKLSPLRKYTLAILAARELRQIHQNEKALNFYQIAKDIKVEENKIEITQALSKQNLVNPKSDSSLFFFEVNLKTLLKNKQYDRAILSINPEALASLGNKHYRVVYDLLNAKIKKRNVKKLYCFDDYQKSPDDYHYTNLLCDFLQDHLRDDKYESDHIKILEEYFFKHDLQERYLLQFAKDLKSNF